MKYDLAQFEDLERHGYLRKVETDDLVLYGYTDQTTFERAWDTKYTRNARGIIFEKATGRLVAKPFPKFFNMGEHSETQILSFPKEPYRVFEKVDGSLGIIYYYKSKWNVATRGSFSSEQAIKAQEMLKKYNLDALHPTCTYLVEIIYPENKIIVHYGVEERLVMLAAYHNHTETEVDLDALKGVAYRFGTSMAMEFQYTIEEMIALQKTLPKDQEGFVVRFQNGLRVKIKGDEYCKIAKMISQMSYLSFWEAMKNGKVDNAYVSQLPEEFRAEYEPMIVALEAQHKAIMEQICEDLRKIPQADFKSKEGKKTLGLFLQGDHGLKHPKAMFIAVVHNAPALDEYILKQMRPTGNELKVL